MPGKGMLNWSKVLAALEKVKYDGDLQLEIVHERSNEPNENDQTAKAAFSTIDELLKAFV